MSGRRVAGAAAVAIALSAASASAQSIDAARVHRVRVGSDGARGARVDPARTGRAARGLPERPAVIWRRSLAGPLEAPPVVAADGRIAVVVGGSAEVRVFSASGEDLGAAALAAPAALTAPAFLADGTLVILTASGHLAFVGRDLEVRHRVALGLRAEGAQAPTPTASGGVVLAAGRSVVEIDGSGRVIASALLDEVVAAPVAVARAPGGGHHALVLTVRGDLLAMRAPFAPRRLAGLGGAAPGGVAVADDGAVWASVAGAVVRAELRGGAEPWRANATSGVYASARPPTLGLDGSVAFVGVDASLVVMAPSGEVRHRVSLDRTPSATAASGPPTPARPIVADEGAPLLVDPRGRVAFARPSGRVGVVSETGLVAIASERLCAAPIGLAPIGPGVFVVGCGEGTLVAIGEAGEAGETEGAAGEGSPPARRHCASQLACARPGDTCRPCPRSASGWGSASPVSSRAGR